MGYWFFLKRFKKTQKKAKETKDLADTYCRGLM